MKLPKINRALLPLKIAFFCWYGASSSIISYIAFHMRQLGITDEEAHIIFILLPVTHFVCTPLAGMIADKLGRYKDVLMLSVLSSVGFATAILFVPPGSHPDVSYPAINLHCSPDILPHIVVEKCWRDPCDVFYINQTNPVMLEGCSVNCPGSEDTGFVYAATLCGGNDGPCYDNVGRRSLKNGNYIMRMKFQKPYPEKSSCRYPVDGVPPVHFENIHSENDILKGSCPVVVNEKGLNCTVKCSFLVLSEDENENFNHINRCVRTGGNQALTFWLYFFFLILFNIFSSICFTLLDVTALAMSDAHGGQYGRQRFWAILARAIFSPVTGFLVDLSTERDGYYDYSPAFYFHNVLAVGTAIAVWMMTVDAPPPAENVIKNFGKLLKVLPVIALMVAVFWLGVMWKFVKSFLLWYITEFETSTALLALIFSVGATAGLPFLYASDWFARKAGKVNLLLLALLFYFIRFIGYSFMNNPWWCILFEAMEVFTYHLMWVAAVTYGAELAPRGLLATIQGCVGGFYFGAGGGLADYAGAAMVSRFGVHLAFRYMGIASGVMFIIYGVVYYGYLRKREKKNENEVELNSTNIVSTTAIGTG